MALSARDTDHVFQVLRGGQTPDRGLEAFATAPGSTSATRWAAGCCCCC